MPCARSQLDLYLDDCEQSLLPHHDNVDAISTAEHSFSSANLKPVASCSTAVRVCHGIEWFVGHAVFIVLRAVLSDTLHTATHNKLRVVGSKGIEATETKSLCMALFSLCDSPRQRCITCVLLLYICYCLAFGALGRGITSVVYLYCHQSLWAMLFLYLLTPILMGTMINAQTQRMLAKSISCVTMVSHLLKCIKRLQLINMGGVISQPTPPIAQLESKLLSTMAGVGGSRGLLSCRAVRRGLHIALNLLTEQALGCSRDMHTAVVDVNRSLQRSGINAAELAMGGIDAPDVSLLLYRPTVDGIGATDTPLLVELQHSMEVVLDGYLSLLPSKLILMLSRCYSLCNCAQMNLHDTGTHHDSYAALEGSLSQVYWRIALFISMLSLLLRLPFYLHSMTKIMDSFEHDCCELGKQIAVVRSGGQHDVSTVDKSLRYHGHEYISMRRKLSCIRSAFDTISHRIWLAEEVLCDPSVVEYWLSDHLSGRDVEEHRRSLQVLCDAMSKLSGSTREGGSAAGDASMHLQSIELQLNSLPAIVDYKELFRHVELLQQAIAQCSSCPSENSDILSDQSSSHHTPIHPVVTVHDDDDVTVDKTSSSFGDLCLLESSGVQPTEDDFEAAAGSVSLSPCADTDQSGGVLDIYVTTIPSQTDQPSIRDRSEIAATKTNARSNTSQRLFMTELRDRLHRIDSCSTDRSGAASSNTGGDDLNRSSSFPTRYCLERVTELRLSDGGDVHDALEVRWVKTDVTRASLVAPQSNALSDSFHCSSSSLRHDDSCNMVRIGSLMVPRDQSEQYALHTTTTITTGRSVLSESMTREIIAESNLFAALSARREAEVIAGDFDADHS